MNEAKHTTAKVNIIVASFFIILIFSIVVWGIAVNCVTYFTFSSFQVNFPQALKLIHLRLAQNARNDVRLKASANPKEFLIKHTAV
jgi:hypothetical protein